MGPAQQQVETPSKLVSASEKSCSRRSDAELGQTKSERESQGLLLPPVAAELRGAEEGGQGDAKGPFKTPCLCEDQLSLRPVTMATGPAQCGGRGGRSRCHGNTSRLRNSSDEGRGEGSLSVKETGTPPQVDDVCYSFIREPLASII